MKSLLVKALSLLYLFLLLYLLLFNKSRLESEDELAAHFIPFVHTIKAVMAPKPNDFWVLLLTDLLGNLLLFMPFGFLGALMSDKQTKIVFSAFLFSLLMELLQYFFKLGVLDANDIILNTAGAFLGAHLIRGTRLQKDSIKESD